MSASAAPVPPLSLGRWIWRSTLGWLLGLLILVAIAMAWGGLTGHESQWMVGVGMGAGVGWVQARGLQDRGIDQWRWVIASAIALGLPFILWDVGRAIDMAIIPSMPIGATVGSVLVAATQSRLLSAGSDRTIVWLVASVVGWGIPVNLIAIGDAPIFGDYGGTISTAAMLLGGAALGLTTGLALRMMPIRSAG